MVAGPFGNKEFGRVMYIMDQLLSMLFYDKKNHAPVRLADRKSYRRNSSKKVEVEHLTPANLTGKIDLGTNFDGWKDDVADKWFNHTHVQVDQNVYPRPSLKIQNLLHACNLQEVLLEAVSIDPYMAKQDTTSAESDIQESHRRITMMIRAALSLTSAFVFDNLRNQEVMFSKINCIKKFILPPERQVDRESSFTFNEFFGDRFEEVDNESDDDGGGGGGERNDVNNSTLDSKIDDDDDDDDNDNGANGRRRSSSSSGGGGGRSIAAVH
jgi:hypothetical protein